jgi:hypothetical protein
MERISIAPDGTPRLEIADAKGEIWDYALRPAPRGLALHSYYIERLDTESVYRLWEDWPGRWECSCPAHKYRKDRQRPCKHLQCLLSLTTKQRLMLDSLLSPEVSR